MSKFNPCPPVLYINREEDVDRRSHMEHQFKEVGIENYLRFPAFTGDLSSLTLNYEPSHPTEALVSKCLVSHLLALKSLDFSTHGYALIFEDDAVLTTAKRWPFSWHEFVDALPKNWDVIQLYINNPFTSLDPTLHIRKYHPKHYSTLAYAITKEHADKMVRTYFTDGTVDFKKVIANPMYPGEYLADRAIFTNHSYSVNLFSTSEFVSTILEEVPDKYHKNSLDVIRLWETSPVSLGCLFEELPL